MEKKFRIFIKKYKVSIYITIACLGIILIILAGIRVANSEGIDILYDVLLGVGGSFVSTAIVTIVLIFSLPDESGENAELVAWGLEKIHLERRVARISSDNFPEKQLDYIAFGLQHFRTENKNIEKIARKVKRGLHVRILTLHPDSEYIKSQEQMEGSNRLSEEIIELYKWVNRVKDCLGSNPAGSIEIKFYDNLPLDFFCHADNKIWFGPYQPGIASGDAITYELKAKSEGGKKYAERFQRYWNGECNVNIVSIDRKRYHGDQRKSIESILKYFCKMMKGDSNSDIIGVVVLFKDALRRTIFSCNKPYGEKHNCYPKDAGVVGELIRINQGMARISLFRDFTNQLSITHSIKGRENGELQKSDYAKNNYFQNDTDTKAILATGLYDRDDRLIGAITFDFHIPASQYLNEVHKLQEIAEGTQVLDAILLGSWFEMASACSDMVSNMLGHDISTDFQRLFDSEWEEHNGKV